MEYFGMFGLIAFVLMMTYSGYPGRVRRLESAVKKTQAHPERGK